MPVKVSYMKRGEKYLIVKEDGTSELLESKKAFEKYIKDNDCVIIK